MVNLNTILASRKWEMVSEAAYAAQWRCCCVTVFCVYARQPHEDMNEHGLYYFYTRDLCSLFSEWMNDVSCWLMRIFLLRIVCRIGSCVACELVTRCNKSMWFDVHVNRWWHQPEACNELFFFKFFFLSYALMVEATVLHQSTGVRINQLSLSPAHKLFTWDIDRYLIGVDIFYCYWYWTWLHQPYRRTCVWLMCKHAHCIAHCEYAYALMCQCVCVCCARTMWRFMIGHRHPITEYIKMSRKIRRCVRYTPNLHVRKENGASPCTLKQLHQCILYVYSTHSTNQLTVNAIILGYELCVNIKLHSFEPKVQPKSGLSAEVLQQQQQRKSRMNACKIALETHSGWCSPLPIRMPTASNRATWESTLSHTSHVPPLIAHTKKCLAFNSFFMTLFILDINRYALTGAMHNERLLAECGVAAAAATACPRMLILLALQH